MRDDLLLYYERELTFLRQMGAEFAGKYPEDRLAPAHRVRQVRRSARRAHARSLRVSRGARPPQDRRRISRDHRGAAEHPLSALHAAHSLHVGGGISRGSRRTSTPDTGLKLDRGAVLRSRPLNGVPCKFRTCYDVTFWPLSVAEAEWTTPDRLKPPLKSSEAVAAVRIRVALRGRRCLSQTLAPFAALLSQRRKLP